MKRILVMMALAGCGSLNGLPCTSEGSAVCADSQSAVFCEQGYWREIWCRGPQGCWASSASGRVMSCCDVSRVIEGEPCLQRQTYSCLSPDLFAVCRDGAWRRDEAAVCDAKVPTC